MWNTNLHEEPNPGSHDEIARFLGERAKMKGWSTDQPFSFYERLVCLHTSSNLYFASTVTMFDGPLWLPLFAPLSLPSAPVTK